MITTYRCLFFDMIEFRELTLDDIESLRPFFSYQKGRICDCTVGGTFMWRDYFNTRYAIIENTLVFMVDYLNHRRTFTYPMGEHIDAALDALTEYCTAQGSDLIFSMVSRVDLYTLHKKFPSVTYLARGEWSDYLYNKDDIVSLKGKRYNGQRNHINRFLKLYPNYSFDMITPDNLPAVRDFYISFMQDPVTHKNGELFSEESQKALEVLNNYEKYGLFGGALSVDDRIVGFAVGEIINDTLYVHIEKASRECEGAYNMLVNSFAEHFATDDILYINREEDDGDMGLRKSKLSYHPVDILEKFTATICLSYDERCKLSSNSC